MRPEVEFGVWMGRVQIPVFIIAMILPHIPPAIRMLHIRSARVPSVTGSSLRS